MKNHNINSSPVSQTFDAEPIEDSYAAKLASIPRLFSDETRPAINDSSVPRGVTHNTPYSRVLQAIPDKMMRDDERPINDNTGRGEINTTFTPEVAPSVEPVPSVPVSSTENEPTPAPEPTIIDSNPIDTPDTKEIKQPRISERTRRVIGGAALVGVGAAIGFGAARGIDWMQTPGNSLPLPSLPKKSELFSSAKRGYMNAGKIVRDKKFKRK